MECYCPDCGCKIPLDDVNVAKDVALCRRCGKTFSFSEIMETDSSVTPDLDHPPKHLKVFREMTDRGATCVRFVFRKMHWGALLFLVPFTCVWSGVSLGGIYGKMIARHQFDPGSALFGLPFLIGTVILIGVILVMLAGRWELTVEGDVVTSFTGVGPFGFRRHYTWTRETRVSVAYGTTRVNNSPVQELFFRDAKAGATFHCGVLVSDGTLEFIAAYLRSIRR